MESKVQQINLKAEPREITGHNVRFMRRDGLIPAVLYGKGFEAISLTLNDKDFRKIYKTAGSSAIVTLKVGDATHKILIHAPQKHPVTDLYLHVDLYKVNMKEEIHTEIPLVFIGESNAVKNLEGNLVTLKDEVEVECLPDNLVSEIEVDLSKLETFDDVIKLSDIVFPEGIKVLDDLEDTIVQVTPPRSDEEMESLEETAADAEKAAIESIEASHEAEKAQSEEKTEDK